MRRGISFITMDNMDIAHTQVAGLKICHLAALKALCISLNAVLLRHLIAALLLPALAHGGIRPICLSHTHTYTHLSSRYNLPAYLTPKQSLPLLCQCTDADSRVLRQACYQDLLKTGRCRLLQQLAAIHFQSMLIKKVSSL